LENERVEDALREQTMQVDMLREMKDIDSTGRIESALTKAEQGLKDIQRSGASKHNKKAAKYDRSLKRNDSAYFLAL